MNTITETREHLRTKNCVLVPNDSADTKWKVRFKTTGATKAIATLDDAVAAAENFYDEHQAAQIAASQARQKEANERRAAKEREKVERRAERVVARLRAIAALGERATAARARPEPYREDSIFRALYHRLESAVEASAEFRADHEADPLHTMQWGVGALEAAANEYVFRGALESMAERMDAGKREEIGPFLLDVARREIVRVVASPSSSSNPMSNLCEQYKAAAWATVLEVIQWEGVR